MKYLITGGAGFIGSHLAQHLLAKGHEVIIYDDLSSGRLENIPPSSCFEHGCILDTQKLQQQMLGIDGCFHLAAIASVQKSIEDWPGTNKVNLHGTINVFKAASIYKVPVVYASSAAVYGDNSSCPLLETELPAPLSGYAADKYACELQAMAFGRVFGLHTFGLRLFNVYGSRQYAGSQYSGVISAFLSDIKEKKEITIFGDGSQVRDFISVKDVIKSMEIAMLKASSLAPVTNVCTGVGTSINDLAAVLSNILGSSGVKYMPSRPGDILISVGSPNKAKANLGFIATVPLNIGLSALCAGDEP